MKKINLIAAFILCLFTTCLIAQNPAIGLTTRHLPTVSANIPQRIVSKIHTPYLNLPQYKNPVIAIRQNVFYSQNFYPQTSQKVAFENHDQWMNRQLQMTRNQRDLLIERAVESALVKLFNLD